jgi:hypothetical protein
MGIIIFHGLILLNKYLITVDIQTFGIHVLNILLAING